LRRTTACAVAAVLAVAGCGDDDEPTADTAARTEPAATTETEPPRATVTAPGPAPTETIPPESPEDQPGGAGDEVPARSIAMFTGRRGEIRPRVVRVPPFIAIRVELRSADGRTYALRFRDRTLRVGGELASRSTVFPGMRAGQTLVGRPAGPTHNGVAVEASAEPGP
jgi:hypothetical protein